MNPIPPSAVAALHEGRKIEAVKRVRPELGVDLKAAKERVEEFLRADPPPR
jgi:ribosomal protein L7/L12